MNRCIIITGFIKGLIRDIVHLQEQDYIICADAGLDLALKEHIIPHLFIGDGDSTDTRFEGACISLPTRKDDTDLLYAVKHAVGCGYTDLWIIGGIGGRFDHSIASLQTLSYALEKGVNARIVDEQTEICLCADRLVLSKKEGYTLSIFAFGGPCSGVSLSGTSYLLKNADLSPSFPVGVSNLIVEESAVIEVKSGHLLVVQSKEKST